MKWPFLCALKWAKASFQVIEKDFVINNIYILFTYIHPFFILFLFLNENYNMPVDSWANLGGSCL